MSDPQSAPVSIPAQGPVEKPTQASNNRSNNSHGHGRGRGRGGGSRGGGGGGGHANDRIGLMEEDADGVNRRKKPEVQHYKPPPFHSNRRDGGGYEGGHNSNHHHNHHYYHQNDNMGDNKHYGRGGGRGGSGRRNHQQASNDLDHTTEKFGQMSVDDQGQNHRGNHGNNKRKNKKPEQPHYLAKKPGNNEGGNQDPESGPKDPNVKEGPKQDAPNKEVPKQDGNSKEGQLKQEGVNKEAVKQDGQNKDGYQKEGPQKEGHNRGGLHKDGHSKDGLQKDNQNKEGQHKDSYHKEGHSKGGHHKEGQHKGGLHKDGQQKDNYHKDGYSREGHNKYDGFHKDGSNRHSNRSGEDVKSEGGGSNTSTYRRNKHKNRNRNLNDKQQDSSNKEVQAPLPPPKHNKTNGGDSEVNKPIDKPNLNGFTDPMPDQKTEEPQPGSYHADSSRGRYPGGGRGGKGRRGGHSPFEASKDPPSRKTSPSNRDVAPGQYPNRYPQDDGSRASVDRNSAMYNDRRSPSVGPNTNHYNQGGNHHRSQSPHRRGGGGVGGIIPIGPRHHRMGPGPGPFNRNSESSDWRFHREGSSHDDYHQPQSMVYDRWGNDYKSGGRGGKVQVAKTNLPPRFQRAQQQHYQQLEEEQLPTQQFRRRSSARRSEESEADRPWRRDSQSGENGEKPDADQSLPGLDLEEEFSSVDWSEGVEEEERLEQRTGSATPVLSPSTTPVAPERGIIRLPPSQGPGSGSWRSNNDQQDMTNPALRGLQHHDDIHFRNTGVGFQNQHPQGGNYWSGSRPPRPLFDPRNPNKPLPVQNYQGGIRPPPGTSSRFMLDSRFMHPPPMPIYRAPFPPMNQPPPNARLPYPSPPCDLLPIPKPMETITKCKKQLADIYQAGGTYKMAELWETEVAECRLKCLKAFKLLLETELHFCAQHDVEFLIWQICFYHLVEALKSLLPDDPSKEIHQKIVDLIDEGIEFYEAMLVALDQTYSINLEKYYDVLEPRSDDKNVRCVLVSAQKCLLCLGDLARYKEQIKESTNYGTARQYYQKACNIDIRNGKPFNQLAILALWAKRKFETVYYNMRCLLTHSPVRSSQEGLTMIFEEFRKKWESSEKKRLDERESKQSELESHGKIVKGTRFRREIWIRPEGGRRLHRTTSAREVDSDDENCEDFLNTMTTSDLNRRFNVTFLYLIGKLYTNINLDSFSLGAQILIKEFKVLVSRTPLPIDSKRLVQIMSLNMFIIDHTKMKGKDTENYRTLAQNSALQLGFKMFSVLLERCNQLLETFTPKPEEASRCKIFQDEDLPTLLSAVKVWCDWIIGNNDVWFPVVCTEPFAQLAKLATHLEKFRHLTNPVIRTFVKTEQYLTLPNQSDYEMVKLEEDGLLSGFNPWFRGLDWLGYRRYSPKSVPSSLAQDVRRLDAINFCIDFLEGSDPPILKWSTRDNAHISLLQPGSDSFTPTDELGGIIPKGSDILDESYSDEEGKPKSANFDLSADSGHENDDVRRLKNRKDELERRSRQEEESRRIRDAIISEHVSVLIEVCPKVIVPDTNCFVDHLTEIGRISASGVYQLRVPLVVLSELDGLAKGTFRKPAFQKKYSSPEHAKLVSENAKRALIWLKDRPANTKGVTSRGTIVTTLAITSEEDTEADCKNNDDLILDVCLNLTSKDTSTEARSDTLKVVRQDVVLLTDDRNLRLKAHTNDMPVTTIPDFIHWAFENDC